MDDLLLSEVQIIVKNLKKKQNKTKQKYTVGLYWEVYFRKTEGTIKILVEKKKYWTQRIEKDWINHANVVTQEFLLAIFSKQRRKY